MDYVYIETYDPTYSYFYYYDSNDEICYLESTLGDDGKILSVTVSDPWSLCPTVATYDWTNMDVTLNDDGTLKSYTGPQGDILDIYDYDTLFAVEPAYYYEIYAAEPFEGAFDFDNHYGLIETYDEDWNWFYYYDSTGEICDLQTVFDTDGTTMLGWTVLDTFDACSQVADGWTYAGITYDDEGNKFSFDAEGGETW